MSGILIIGQSPLLDFKQFGFAIVCANLVRFIFLRVCLFRLFFLSYDKVFFDIFI